MEKEFIKFEQPVSPDKVNETKVEAKPEKVTEKISEQSSNTPVSAKKVEPKAKPVAKPIAKDPQVQEIENILAAGLGDYYTSLNPVEQKKFKESGEEVAKEVNSILQRAVIKVEEIIGVIRKWLGSVPGLNKFFVEQSAKIKADKILISRRK
ncbi:MAG: hypothetical protein ACKKL6_01410 [Candidatus Komeilibacteria bacterium]